MGLDAATHTDERTGELLERVKGVFAAKGFDGASMQDLARGAGISAGNFYRYFPSKNAIIEAMVGRDLAEIERDFATIMRAPDPYEALRISIREHIETPEKDGILWAEIEAAAARRAEIGAISARFQAAVQNHLIRVFARISALSDRESAERFSAHAALIVMLVKGAVIGGCGASGAGTLADQPEIKALVLRVVDRILNEVSGRLNAQD